MFWATVCSATPQITIRTEYYDVQGLTDSEIRANLDAHQRKTHGFGGHDGMTTSNFHWWASPPRVQGEIVYHMPHWTDEERAPATLREKWGRFIKALQIHEDGHRQIIENETIAIEQALLSADRSKQSRLSHDINILMGSFDRKQLDYDKETQHGKTQGAVFNSEGPPAISQDAKDARAEWERRHEALRRQQAKNQ